MFVLKNIWFIYVRNIPSLVHNNVKIFSNAPVTVEPAEMTCGIKQQSQFCLQTGGFYRECQICDAYDPALVTRQKYLLRVENI